MLYKNHATIFRKALLSKIEDIKISNYILSGLANILAIDFDLRNITTEIEPYASSCADKIVKYIGDQSALSENFDDVLALFAAAIANDKNHDANEQTLQNSRADEETIQQVFRNCPKLLALNDADKLKVTNILLNLKKIDPQITFNLLLQDSRIIPKTTKEIDLLESQQHLIKHLLSFLQQKNKQHPTIETGRYKSLFDS